MSLSGIMGKSLAVLLFTGLVFGVCMQADAAGKAPKLKLDMTISKEVKSLKDGKEVVQAVPTDKLAVGDVAVYTITYTNKGKDIAKNATISDPIPPNTVYVLDSAEGADTEITCSIDGGKSFVKQPVKITINDKDGKKEVDAPAEKYTTVKWVVKKELKPGDSGKVSFKVKVK